MDSVWLGKPLIIVALLPVLVTLPHIASSVSAQPFHYVTHMPGEVEYWARWSPDGKTIIFSRCDISTGCAGGAPGGIWKLFTEQWVALGRKLLGHYGYSSIQWRTGV